MVEGIEATNMAAICGMSRVYDSGSRASNLGVLKGTEEAASVLCHFRSRLERCESENVA